MFSGEVPALADSCGFHIDSFGGDGYDMVSKREARRALAMAMVAIGRSSDPLTTFQSYENLVSAALSVLGREFDAKAFLSACGVAAEHHVPAAMQSAGAGLPEDAFNALRQVLSDVVEVTQCIGDAEDGYEFEYRRANELHEGFAIFFHGRWVVAPGPLGREDLEEVTRAFRSHFDFFIAMTLHMRGMDDDSIAEMREHLGPARALFPHEHDPKDYTQNMPLVFAMANPTPLARRFYCGFNPLTGEATPYDAD